MSSSYSFSRLVCLAGVATLLGACATPSNMPGGRAPIITAQPGQPDLDAVPDAIPREEPLHRFANQPYIIQGRTYSPMIQLAPFKQRGMASWYGKEYQGQRTSSGESYDMYAMTAAHPTLPIPSYARVTHPQSGRSIVVRINDRGPFKNERVIDLSYVAAYKLGLLPTGGGEVEIDSILPGAMPSGMTAAPAPTPYYAPPVSNYAPTPVANPVPIPVQSTAGTVVREGNGSPAPIQYPTVGGTPATVTPVYAQPAYTQPQQPVYVQPAYVPQPPAYAQPNYAPPATDTRIAPPRYTPPTAGTATAAPVRPAVATAPQPVAGGQFFIQVGAFRNQNNADNLVYQLKNRHGAVGSSAHIVSDKDIFRVRVGPYASDADARSVAEQVGSLLNTKATVVRAQ